MTKVSTTYRLPKGINDETKAVALLNEVSKEIANGGNYEMDTCILAEVPAKGTDRVREFEFEGRTYRAPLGRGVDPKSKVFSVWIVSAKQKIEAGSLKRGDETISWSEIPKGAKRLRLYAPE